MSLDEMKDAFEIFVQEVVHWLIRYLLDVDERTA